ncbi:MAG: universal stress protein, partial [Chitinophagaceae bacterium]
PQRKKKVVREDLHEESIPVPEITAPSYRKIAVALDFSINDEKLLSHALGQGKQESEYLLIHVVESATARLLGGNTADLETRNDELRLNRYVDWLKEKGYRVTGQLGFTNRAKEISRIIQEQQADLLVIGAHGHSGIKDWIYGETINSVRHELKIPLLIVNL